MPYDLTQEQCGDLKLLHPDFRYMLDEQQVHPKYMAALAKLGYVSARLFSKYDVDESKVKAGFVSDLQLDASTGAEERINIARLIDVWEVCRKRVEVRQKLEAESSAAGLAKLGRELGMSNG